MSARALIVIEYQGGVLMAAVEPETLTVEADLADLTIDGWRYGRYTCGPDRIVLEGRLMQAIRQWPSWEDFHAETGTAGAEVGMLPAPDRALPP